MKRKLSKSVAESLFLQTLLCSWPFLDLFANNHQEITRPGPLLAYLILYGSFSLLITLFFLWKKGEDTFGQVAVSVGAASSFFLMSLAFRSALRAMSHDRLSETFVLALYYLSFVAILSFAWNLGRSLRFRRALLASAIALCSFPIARFAAWNLTNHKRTQLEVPAIRPRFVRHPNLYFVILDEYGRSDQLLKYLHYDNRPFLQELENRGFFIHHQITSNYPMTILSIPALLESRLLFKDGERVSNFQPLVKALQGSNGAEKTFKANGYQFAQFQSGFSQRFSCKEKSQDLCIEAEGAVGEFELALLKMSPILATLDLLSTSVKEDFILSTRFASVEKGLNSLTENLPTGVSPLFLFAHTMGPHIPYVFNADCSPYRGTVRDLYSEKPNTDLYRNQIQCINRQVLTLVDKIIATDPEAMIVLQGDHGTQFNEWFRQDTLTRKWDSSQMEERLSILSAAKLPQACQENWRKMKTSVNSFRVLFACLQGNDPEWVPDETYSVLFDASGETIIVKAGEVPARQ